MDPVLEQEARRLYISTALTAHAVGRLRGRIPADATAADVLALAHSVGGGIEHVENRHGLVFDPPYPGVTSGVEGVRGGVRLVLACEVRGREGRALGVVFSTFIPGRLPQVSVAPACARVPGGWRPVSEVSPPGPADTSGAHSH